MRTALLAAAALISVPAIASARPAPDTAGLPPELTDPATFDKLGQAMEELSKVLLDLKIGGVEAALQGREPSAAERNRTVRELGKIDDQQLARQMAELKPQIEQSMKALQHSLPELNRSLKQAQEAIERATANLPDPTYPKR
jgi:uncharacterized protein YukE